MASVVRVCSLSPWLLAGYREIIFGFFKNYYKIDSQTRGWHRQLKAVYDGDARYSHLCLFVFALENTYCVCPLLAAASRVSDYFCPVLASAHSRHLQLPTGMCGNWMGKQQDLWPNLPTSG